ncbi:MAG TPA: RdgB/HAM1 family non-canonical purine NTP pyrophosphatase [Caldisericia bacterium]|nr:RdgB/HAM1 family non-canonical purine NTP pyrophosphatase [Caldisericia bacterium]HPF48644.1 RdgB/HAM1 family non-canonical purine NTP pyrophosphatase [Caldisericia bacterium]HPI83696.1 RdgB/HAM1 family non-canonical purine NTP pyrophosphatase [Caldisericia bacterium]HPQ93099.1 RdgB/HAM1 family non-canonical purine NTP pyrophosphatase [Caldisericia bacterium]HRV75068.1 RdgB/HAM1 family non-canonical purine NTP pyrophosphatase [Caldisericia bacterium]
MKIEKILLATSNPGKIREIKSLLPDIEVVLSSDVGLELPEETGTTFEENALIKSEFGFEQTGIPTLAEDSGLVVDALSGAPGIYSARYEPDPVEAYLRVLREMEGKTNRAARFVCVAAFTYSGGSKTFRGTIEGEIAKEPAGEGGFGYDPIFLFDKVHTTAQISKEEKSKISHRGKALREFVGWFTALQ